MFYPFGAIPPEDPNAPGESLWRLENVGTSTLKPSQTLVDSVDFVCAKNFTAYFDLSYEADSGLTFKNQVFFETYESENYASYGFSGYFDSTVVEDRLTVNFKTGNDGTFTTDNVIGRVLSLLRRRRQGLLRPKHATRRPP
ncbi:MAG: hypothetical protein J6386_02825 [Candidatus Synoicihabitans palmerolidicus]|nr:hypothetical protein [Candidatus Synoicihabitans palmerolidicus]